MYICLRNFEIVFETTKCIGIKQKPFKRMPNGLEVGKRISRMASFISLEYTPHAGKWIDRGRQWDATAAIWMGFSGDRRRRGICSASHDTRCLRGLRPGVKHVVPARYRNPNAVDISSANVFVDDGRPDRRAALNTRQSRHAAANGDWG